MTHPGMPSSPSVCPRPTVLFLVLMLPPYPTIKGLPLKSPADLTPEISLLSWSLSAHRFEVAPCPEPYSGAQKSKGLWLSSNQQETERTKAKPKPLLMPINTFSGIVQ